MPAWLHLAQGDDHYPVAVSHVPLRAPKVARARRFLESVPAANGRDQSYVAEFPILGGASDRTLALGNIVLTL